MVPCICLCLFNVWSCHLPCDYNFLMDLRFLVCPVLLWGLKWCLPSCLHAEMGARSHPVLFWVCVCSVNQSCPTLVAPGTVMHTCSCDYEVFQSRILEWGAISYSRGSSWSWDQTISLASPALAGKFFTNSATWEALSFEYYAVYQTEATFLKPLFHEIDCIHSI